MFSSHHGESEAKKALTKVMYLGRPTWDIPILWGLLRETREAPAFVLSMLSFHYLANKFADRRNPVASRLSYALAAEEDANPFSAMSRAAAAYLPSLRISYSGQKRIALA